MNETEPLFMKYHIHDVIRQQEEVVKKAIESLEENQALRTNPDELTDFFCNKFKIDVPELKEEGTSVDREEVELDARGYTDRFFMDDDDEPTHIKGVKFSFFVPFEGDKGLFYCQPSSFTLNPPRAEVENSQIIVSFQLTDDNIDEKSVRSSFDQEISQIRNNLNTLRDNVSSFNSSLNEKIKNLITVRREKLLKQQGVTSSLGFPLKKREDAPRTYIVNVPKKIETMPKMSEDPFKPEPELELKKYEEILIIIKSMVLVMERSPKRFRDLDEEAIRDQFLVQLNGQYQGQATGETFNNNGKTDILIREGGKNIFIAECKFWKGAKQFSEAVDQILGYTSWRDTKTAILLFNRTQNFTETIAKAKEALMAHPNFKKQVDYESETGIRCVLKNKDDENRELILTLETFNIPSSSESNSD